MKLVGWVLVVRNQLFVRWIVLNMARVRPMVAVVILVGKAKRVHWLYALNNATATVCAVLENVPAILILLVLRVMFQPVTKVVLVMANATTNAYCVPVKRGGQEKIALQNGVWVVVVIKTVGVILLVSLVVCQSANAKPNGGVPIVKSPATSCATSMAPATTTTEVCPSASVKRVMPVINVNTVVQANVLGMANVQ